MSGGVLHCPLRGVLLERALPTMSGGAGSSLSALKRLMREYKGTLRSSCALTAPILHRVGHRNRSARRTQRT